MDGVAMSIGPSLLSPPPPPPPLPPPPPPPPPIIGNEPFSRSVHRRSKMRNFNWDTIPRHSVVGKRNVWTSNKKLEDIPLDTKRIEELFSHSECQQMPPRHGTVKKSVWGLQSTSPVSEIVSILNSKKSMNIGILLKQFKRPIQDIVEDIREGNMRFAAGRLRELSKLLPDDVEVKKLLSFHGDASQLAEADRFFLMLVNVPGYEERLKSLLLREEFMPFIEEMKKSISIMTAAANELLACDDLHSIIRLVLKAGNYMNADGYAGRAIGFRMTSLLRLVDTKANKPGMNLMHYVAMQAQQIDGDLLRFTEQLQHIGEASRIQKQEVETDFKREMAKTKEAKAYVSKQPDLQHQMEDFLQMATSQLADVEASLRELDSISHSVAEYFCEDPATFKLEECCKIFHSFCEKFEKAVLENTEREAVERRRRQQRERETLSRVAKRRTIAACSKQSSEHEALESVLSSFLSTRPSRRRQPSSNRESPTEMLDKNNPLAERSPIALDSSVNMDKKDASVSVQEQDQSFQITLEIPAMTEQNEISHPEERDKSSLIAQDSPEKVEPVVFQDERQEEKCLDTEKTCCGVNVQCTPAGSKRAPCIEDKATPKSSKTNRRRSILVRQNGGENDEQEKKKEEADEPQEDSLKEPRRIRCPVSDAEKCLNVTDVSSPHHRGIQEVDLAFQNGFGSPWTVLSPHVSPSCMRHRRHSFGSVKDEESEDGVWALPDTPLKVPLLAHTCRSYEHSISTSVISHVGIRDSPLKGTSTQGTLLRSASVGENPESIPSFRFSAFFPRRHGRETKRQEPSSLMSFFQRFGERGRPASIGDSCRVDT
ncbi:FH2 domain containing 3 [Pangasianodon hypophthalmus]|uniref:FH2 domain containing 3 n=1 Tax=Pangasianodon hypophthalmus TaxID=310915 RepID=UPI0023071836|nr:FH2 domain containing 3 [Pangasianodon hypophthalmus]